MPTSAAGERDHTVHGLERRRQLLDVAASLFAEQGYARTRIADIGAAAGVAKGLVYWYFPTKRELFADLVRSMRHDLRRAQAMAMDPAADPLTRIRQGTEASVRFVAEHRAYYALLDMERADPEVAEVLREGGAVYADDVLRLVMEAQRAGQLPDVDPQLFVTGVLGSVTSFGTAFRAERLHLDIDELAAFVGSWVMRALAGTAPAA